ncbi:MAG: ATP-binding protein [Rhodospirillaceae bacterium]|nr:ATP-binding protein [Rhodospirillaceae bacterium]
MTQFHDSQWWSRELKRKIRDQEPENLHLDYKDKQGLLPPTKGGGGINKEKRATDVSKDVTSFLNSDGGVLIYGVPEDQGSASTGGAPVPITQSGLIGLQPGEIDKETIENLITSNIQPKPGPELFQIAEVEYDTRIVFIVEIAVGRGDVWQAKDKRYYKRFHYKAEAMEHYEIQLVRDRRHAPDLKLVFGLDNHWVKEKRSARLDKKHTLFVGIQNRSNPVVETALIELGVSLTGFSKQMIPPFRYIGNRTIEAEPWNHDVDWYELTWPIDGAYKPIFKTVGPLSISEFSIPVEYSLIDDYSIGQIFWRIQAPSMSPKMGFMIVEVARGGYRISIREMSVDFKVEDEP